MKKRPSIKMKLSRTDKLLEVAGWGGILVVWIVTLINYSALPEIIPIHYNSSGQVDGFGEKYHILILNLVMTFLYVGMTILNRYPHLFNFPVKITEENAEQQYTNMTKMIRIIKLMIVVALGFLSCKTVENSMKQQEGFNSWVLFFMLGLMFIVLIYFIVKSVKMR